MPHPLPKGIPATLKYGSLAFDVFATKDGRIGFLYKDGSDWRTCLRTSLGKLKDDVERVAIALLNAETAVLDMTAEDRRIYIAARDALSSLGIPVDAAARAIAEAHQISGGVALRDLALFHKRNFACLPVEKTVEFCVDYTVAEVEERNLSSRFTRDITNDGKLIKQWFPKTAIADVRTEDLLEKIRTHQALRKFGWKRRNHVREACVYVWGVAKRMVWLPQDRDTAAQRVPALEEPRSWSPVLTYSPEEMRFWIGNINHKYLPWLLVCAFSMVRSEEVAPDPNDSKDRLRWSDFHWQKKYIRIRREVSKTGRKKPEPRNVPMPDNLIAWLAPYRDRTGFVCSGEQPSKRETSRLSAIAAKKQLPYRWKKNALRHTGISAYLGITRDRAWVAECAGTSESKIRKNYNEGFDEDEARAWHAIMPDYADGSGIILPLWQHRRAS
jgi:hypothetical protein